MEKAMLNEKNIVDKNVSEIVDAFQNIREAYKANRDIVSYGDRYISDFYHEVEFGEKKDMYQSWLMIKKFREVLQARRKAKNENELMKGFYELLNDDSVVSFDGKIRDIRNKSNELCNIQSNRTFSARVMEDSTFFVKEDETESDITISKKKSKKKSKNKNKSKQNCGQNKGFEKMMRDFKRDGKPHLVNGKLRK